MKRYNYQSNENIEKNNIFNNVLLKKICMIMITFVLVLSINIKVEAANRVCYSIKQVTLTSYQITLRWQGVDLGNIQITACMKEDDNTLTLFYRPYTKNNIRTITVDMNDLNMNLKNNKPNVILKDNNGYTLNLSDYPEDKEMKEAIFNLYQRGIINGYDDNTFKPYNKITKEEFCSLFFNMMEYSIDNTEASKFYDLRNDRWSKNIIMTLNKLGVITGQDDGSFGILKDVSLSEVSTMIVRAKNLMIIPGDFKMTHNASFHWANDFITKMFTNGLIKPNDTFYSSTCQNYNLTRGQVAVILNRV